MTSTSRCKVTGTVVRLFHPRRHKWSVNEYFNGHPDLVVKGRYPNNSAKAGVDGVEIKSTRKSGGAVDMHGAREQWLCVFVYIVDLETEPATARRPMTFR